MNTMCNRRAFSTMIALLVAACGGGTEGTGSGASGSGAGSGSGGNGNAGPGGMGSGGSTASNGSSSGGSGATCNPTLDNNYCAGASSCECAPTDTTEQSYCEAWAAEGVQICAAGANVCSPGHNQCGYDLPMGEDYVPPTDCAGFIAGDIWVDESANKGYAQSVYNANWQLTVGFAVGLSGSAGYYNGFIVSGKKIYWNLANRATAESAEGEFTNGCETIVMKYFHPGENTQYLTQTIQWQSG